MVDIGFERTKATFWVKERPNTIQFIHVHSLTYNYAFRLHLGVRVKNDAFDAVSLNGPTSFDGWWMSNYEKDKKQLLEFNKKEDSIELCTNNILDFLQITGIPWFKLFENDIELINNQTSPLNDVEKSALAAMINKKALPDNIELSKKILRLDKLKK